ncbi:helix-turn-helix domain-containing protein [Nocardia brevicatena]|uniref:helix-turn-helix domain-containing protein n=1 Tax=Nocardia brevicatena TaxID=37327 RepID=UPI0002FC3305|nr:helix-turn-helix domain-containing protein [Nocardia brevicatena]
MPEQSPPPSERKKTRKPKRVAARRDFDALRKRRMRAAEMFAAGRRQIDVVVELGVSAQTASRWHKTWIAQGRDGLAGAGRAGRRPRLTDTDLGEVEAALAKGPKANGFATDMWTPARVAEVIEMVTGVRYSRSQTWTILRSRLDRRTFHKSASRCLRDLDESLSRLYYFE